MLTGVLIAVVGLGVSAALAGARRAGVDDGNRRSFQVAAADLASALDAKLAASLALTRAMRAIAAMEPSAGEARFAQWYAQLQRQGGEDAQGVDAVLIVPVPAARLAQFRRRLLADPVMGPLLHHAYHVLPAGRRPLYCLTRAIVGPQQGSAQYPLTLDYCAPTFLGARSPYPQLIHTVASTGAFIVTPVLRMPGTAMVAIGAAVYRRGAPLATVAQRRAAAIGYIATTFDGDALIRSVMVPHGTMSIALYHRNPGGGPQLIGRVSGPRAPGGGYRVRSALDGGWSVVLSGAPAGAPSADLQALLVLAIGLLVTGLLLALYLSLAFSRQHAWWLVGERTEELRYRALHDPLTGLPNRRLVLDRAEQVLARARRLDVPVSALFLDIDGFKAVNDRFGHKTGDDVLRQVAARLRTVVRASDTVGRLGGDEFVIVLDCSGADSARPQDVAERVLAVLSEPLEVPEAGHAPVCVSGSIGITTALPPTAEDLLQEADIAMYQAKAAGKAGYVRFESSMQAAIADRLHLEMDLSDALAAEQLFLEYQPVLSLASGEVVAVEALLRWAHPTRGVIKPDGFLPIAEASGMIAEIGRWVLEQACAQAARWEAAGHALGVSVNVSSRQFERPEFPDDVRDALGASGLDPALLTLEVAEATLVRRPEALAEALEQLKALGVSIAVDDFGTGYSSLGYLRRFPIDALKIDRSFVNALSSSREADALARSLIELGKALGIQTLAEGVERPEQLRRLRSDGCDLGQGQLFARPLSAEALESFLHAERAEGAPASGEPAARG